MLIPYGKTSLVCTMFCFLSSNWILPFHLLPEMLGLCWVVLARFSWHCVQPSWAISHSHLCSSHLCCCVSRYSFFPTTSSEASPLECLMGTFCSTDQNLNTSSYHPLSSPLPPPPNQRLCIHLACLYHKPQRPTIPSFYIQLITSYY